IPREITKELLWIKKHFETILKALSEGVLELTPDARIVYANPTAVSLIGIPQERLLGSDFIKLFSKKDQKRVKELLSIAIDTFRMLEEKHPVLLNSKEVILQFLPVKDDEYKSIIVILKDISEKIKIQTRIIQAQKMEAIGTLAGGIAHDFNNLLMAISGRVSLMLMKIEPNHPFVKHLKAIEDTVKQGARLTSQLLGFARKGKYEVKPIDINNVIENCLEIFGRAKKEIEIFKNYEKNIWTVEANPSQMEQVFLNVLVNAADAMPESGKIYIETKNVTVDKSYVKTLPFEAKTGDYVKISITDTGVGMDETIKQRIFEPFFTTKPLGKGTGLGLASVYGIVKNHEGFVTVYSEKGKGSTFNIYLPASKKEIKERHPVSTEVSKGEGIILLVDDEEDVLSVGEEMLKLLGYNVFTAKTGEEAIKIYKENKDKIDLVILDMIMPSMSGKEVFKKLKEIDKKVKVIFSSGYSFEHEVDKVLKECEGFIQKPFGLKEISQKVEEILGKKPSHT
ncbi:MAG TPA: PAS domain-containing sensor histidine kinase, partial [Candidatus Desulfofervidus auxilii]|nr:PAS domain-containing sensor histidine kinase [Candidatus Desulfofervidus auxilii]